MRSSIGKIVALVVTGFGIGWLAGLSVSPVVSIVITSVTGSVATIVAALSGVKDELLDRETSPNTVRRWLRGVTPVPLAWLVVGLIIGAGAGILVRTNNMLSPAPAIRTLSDDVTEWVDLGLPKEDVVKRLFDARFSSVTSGKPTTYGAEPTAVPASPKDSVLFAAAIQSECKTWTGLIEKQNYEELRIEISSSAAKSLRELPKIITDNLMLADIVGKVLCAETSTQP